MQSLEIKKLQPDQYNILNQFLGEHPVKLGQIANELGVDIKVSALGAGISGQIKKEDNHYVIRVNRHEARERQRFTIAHELAHYLLHKDVIDSSPEGIRDNVLYRSGKPEQIEFEANRLAADIVMPAELVQKKLQELGGIVNDTVIEKLAADFEVSKVAMEIRLSSI